MKGRSMAKGSIPGGITPEQFMKIRQFLIKILDDSGAAVVNMRLNETGTAQIAPVFVGWVENKKLARKRESSNKPDTGLFRFADTIRSKEYTDTVLAKGSIRERDWRRQISEKDHDQKKVLPTSGVNYQKLIGIMVARSGVRRCVGSLNLGFESRPRPQAARQAEKIMRYFATSPKSELIAFLKENFELGAVLVSQRSIN